MSFTKKALANSQRYFLEFGYAGTDFHGWARQPNAQTVQETLESCLSTLMGFSIEVTGAGRTDTGVHARSMFGHMDLPAPPADMEKTIYALNSMLPKSIAVYRIWPVKPEAHARFSAIQRSYTYRWLRHKNPFEDSWAWRCRRWPDFQAMESVSKNLLEVRDFAAFCKMNHDAKTTICTLKSIDWKWDSERGEMTVRADRFLRNMVRAMVGTLMEVGWGRMSEAQFMAVVHSGKRTEAGVSVPARGLTLEEIVYPPGLWDGDLANF